VKAPINLVDRPKVILRRNVTVDKKFLRSNEPNYEPNHKSVIFFDSNCNRVPKSVILRGL
jgi:hypothetical protein